MLRSFLRPFALFVTLVSLVGSPDVASADGTMPMSTPRAVPARRPPRSGRHARPAATDVDSSARLARPSDEAAIDSTRPLPRRACAITGISLGVLAFSVLPVTIMRFVQVADVEDSGERPTLPLAFLAISAIVSPISLGVGIRRLRHRNAIVDELRQCRRLELSVDLDLGPHRLVPRLGLRF